MSTDLTQLSLIGIPFLTVNIAGDNPKRGVGVYVHGVLCHCIFHYNENAKPETATGGRTKGVCSVRHTNKFAAHCHIRQLRTITGNGIKRRGKCRTATHVKEVGAQLASPAFLLLFLPVSFLSFSHIAIGTWENELICEVNNPVVIFGLNCVLKDATGT